MARKQTRPDTITTTIRMDKDLHREVHEERGDVPFTQVVEEGARMWLKTLRRTRKRAAKAE